MLELKIDSKYFNNHNLPILRSIELNFRINEFVSFYGPNGCGKTTLMRIISGLDNTFEGTRKFNDKIKIAYVFQNYESSLFPWYNALDNMTYYLIINKQKKQQRIKKLESLLDELQIEIDLYSFPSQLSGGQKQLISILRTLIMEPNLLILDEAFSSLDEEIKIKMVNYIQNVFMNEKISIIHISHDLDESLLLANKLYLLNKIENSNQKSIINHWQIDFNRPRNLKLLETVDFFKTKSDILSNIRKEIYEKSV